MDTIRDFDKIRLKIASPEEILGWSFGEVTKPETINYRTQRPEKDGLFDERIFGPTKDYECYCGKYRKRRYKGVVCDKCGVEVTSSRVRRERMGHIKLAAPVAHFWFTNGVSSKLALLLGISYKKLERVIYFTSYMVTSVDKEEKEKAVKELEKEFERKSNEIKKDKELTKQEGAKKLEKLESEYKQTRKQLKGLHKHQVISEVEYYNLSKKFGQVFEAGTGAEAVKKVVANIDLETLQARLKERLEDASSSRRRKMYKQLRVVESFLKNNINPEWMFLTVLPVIPPDLRPMIQLDGGRFATSDINDLYRRVINRNNRLRRLKELNAPEIIKRNEKRMLQEAVDALIDNSARKGKEVRSAGGQRRILKSLADILKGKEGRFRRNLLGKRVDYSGRSVIVAGPELELNECGIPKKMALEIFKPFVVHNLIEERGVASNMKQATTMIAEEEEVVWDALDSVIEGKLVLLNRAPTLHKLSIQAFKPVLIEGLAIKLHPLVCQGFNADFDGDQMAVHLPLSDEAQKEAWTLSYAPCNLLKPATGRPIVNPTQDIVLGIYWLTNYDPNYKDKENLNHFASFAEAKLAYHSGKIGLREPIRVREEGQIITTSVGRIIFNSSFYPQLPFQNEVMDKEKLKDLVGEIVASEKIENPSSVLDAIKKVGFHYSTLSGISWGMNDLAIPDEKSAILKEAQNKAEEINSYYQKGLLTDEERKTKVIEVWFDAVDEVHKLVPKQLPEGSPIYSIFDSGSRGSWGQLAQMAGLKGQVVNPASEIIELPIKSSFKEGFNVLEYFISTHGARKGTTDTALKTAKSGYLTRRLVDVAQDIIVRQEDCGDKEGFYMYRKDGKEIGLKFADRITGRTVAEDVKIGQNIVAKKGTMLNRAQAEKIEESEIEKLKVRSPITCKTRYGICRKCFGYDLSNNKPLQLGTAIGVIAAQSIGEPGTQLTMRTFHAGGVAGGGDITQGLPRVEDLFEARTPKQKGLLCAIDGEVVKIEEEEGKKRVVIRGPQPSGKGTQKKTYTVPADSSLWVKEGEQVKKGQQITEGNLDLNQLFRVSGPRATQRYIIKEVQEVYYSQGAGINEKYIELIVRKMFSRRKIVDPGDTRFLPGEIVEEDVVAEENEKLKSDEKPAKTRKLLLGITRVALSTESFLSAASFQETTRTLIDAAIEGKVDHLRGLKENIIVGKLIPAGTGYEEST